MATAADRAVWRSVERPGRARLEVNRVISSLLGKLRAGWVIAAEFKLTCNRSPNHRHKKI
jgi:hypothetical protein